MATYKVIQDIEAEDKILGPLTLRQFIFALISVFFFYLNFIFLTKGGVFLLIFFLPPALFFGFFALPLGRDQPTEIWALAKLRFLFLPRKRIWNQSGVKELVSITVPKKIEKHLTKGFSQVEVSSRLQALASTIDSRGWAVKHVNTLNAYAPPMYVPQSTDRLIDPASLPQIVPDTDIVPADDLMDVNHNPIAQQFQTMIDQSAMQNRANVMSRMNNTTSGQPAGTNPTNNYWFMNNASSATPIQMAPAAAVIDPAEEAALVSSLKAQAASHPAPYSNLRTVKPVQARPPAPAPKPVQSAPPSPVPAPADPAILSLAERDDLNVSTLAREAKRAKGTDDNSQGEVVVPLH